jgi:putative tryptophan/tyrosine transport system substrate-binding protein
MTLRRRDFITLLGGAAAWPLAARAQQPERMPRVGMLIGPSESDPIYRADATAFKEELSKRGWVEGRNLRIDVRFGEGDARRTLARAAELVDLSPNVIFAYQPCLHAHCSGKLKPSRSCLQARVPSSTMRS